MVSDSSEIFVKPFRFVAPEFVNEVNVLVPFKIFATDVNVAYVLAAVAVVRYDARELVNAYDDNADDRAYEDKVLVKLLDVT